MTKSNREQRVKEAEEFLAELGRGIPEDERVMAGYASEATVQTGADGKKLNAGWWPVPYKAGKFIDPSKNCYACISSSIKTPNPKTGELRYWRGEVSFGHGLALMVDDIGDGAGSKGDFALADMRAILEPTVVVETSPSNYQLWYFLDEPEPEMVRFKAFLVGFVTAVLKKGGDHTIRDVSRYGRMPCGINNKRHTDGAFKYPTEDGVFEPRILAAEYSNRYSIDAIARHFNFPIVISARPAEREIDADEQKIDFIWLKIAQKILAKEGEGSGGQITQNMSGKFRIKCPWGNEHTNGDPTGAYFRGPIPGGDVDFVFGCAHDTCRKAGRNWGVFIDEIVMPRVLDKLDAANKSDPLKCAALRGPLVDAFVKHFENGK